MSIKLVAAYHEAGHVLAAHYSQFHAIIGSINLAAYGSGEAFVALSKRKLNAAGKTANQSAALDQDVTIDFAIVLCGGLMAERIAEEKDGDLKSNPDCAKPDYELLRQQLTNAGLPLEFSRYEDAARQLLEKNWGLVAQIAGYLFKKARVDAVDVVEFLEAQQSA